MQHMSQMTLRGRLLTLGQLPQSAPGSWDLGNNHTAACGISQSPQSLSINVEDPVPDCPTCRAYWDLVLESESPKEHHHA